MTLKTQDFDYFLPEDRIAQTPIEPRDASRLMVVWRESGRIAHRHFYDIIDYLRPGDVLVCNESKVVPARLYGRKVNSGGRVEVLLLSRCGGGIWEALVKPARRLREGTVVEFGSDEMALRATIVGKLDSGARLLQFDDAGDIGERLESLGVVPLPPYVHVPLDDPERYQTVYARVRGSVAAPTAGLHFTPQLIARIQSEVGAEFVFVTLHIGLDTFRPIAVDDFQQHRMHSEYCELNEAVAARLNTARREGRRIIAVGTTSVRVLESAARAARLGGYAECVVPFRGWTDLFIYPGYEFRAVDVLITNFHLPRSTLLLLVSAFAGKALIDAAYTTAIAEGYRFYSFGDAMLLL